MPYIFPKRILRDDDVLDPIELNEDLIPAAELYSGKLNEHNIHNNTSFLATDDMHYKHHYASVSAAPGLTGPPSYNLPNVSATANEFEVPNDQVWTAVDSMSLTFDSNEATLWINAQVQYIWGDGSTLWFLGGTATSSTGTYALHLFASDASNESSVAAIQFALRVDGRIIEWSITGHRDPNFGTAEPVKPEVQKTSSGDGADPETYFPGVMLYKQDDAGAIGPPFLPVRVGAMYNVTPGTHTVELCVRRVTERGPSHTGVLGDSNRLYVMNRQLYVMEIPTLPPAASSYDSIEIEAFDTEDTLSAESLGTSRIDAIRDKYNLIQPGALSRGALSSRHIELSGSGLISPLVKSDSKEFDLNTTSSYFTNYYPGFNQSTFAPTRILNDGWWMLEDTSTTSLGNLQTGSFPITTSSLLSSTGACTFVVFANVRLTTIVPTTHFSDPGYGKFVLDESLFASFCIGYKKSTESDATIVGKTEVLVNNFNNLVSQDDKLTVAESVDVPLMLVLQFDSDPGYDIDYFAVYGSALWQNSGAHPTTNAKVYFRNASIQVLQFRGS